MKGFGVITETPRLIRSSHFLIFLGLPSRTTKETMDWLTMPLYFPRFQPFETMPALSSSVMSGSSDNSTTSAGRPLITARA